jgi:hypothetical protein
MGIVLGNRIVNPLEINNFRLARQTFLKNTRDKLDEREYRT